LEELAGFSVNERILSPIMAAMRRPARGGDEPAIKLSHRQRGVESVA
jgi:hypothetical protein